jgi:hypothetical protein
VQLALNRHNVKPDIRANIHTIEYAIGLVGAGIGCALLPDLGTRARATTGIGF